jgi:peptidyl-prolyl cis-trans isomerase C
MKRIPTLPLCAALLFTACVEKPTKEESQGGTAFKSSGALTEGEKGEVVARVGDQTITLEEFERRLNQQSPFARARYNSLERKREFLDSMIRFELLAKDAEAKGYDKDPDVQLARKQAMVKRLSSEELTKLVKIDDVGDAEVEKYYNEHLAEYDKPAEVRASHILLKDEAAAKALHAELSALAAKEPFKAREAFADAARQKSEDAATREAGGDLQFFGKPGESRAERAPDAPPLPPAAVADAAWAIEKVGDLAPAPIKTSEGWHLVQKTGFKRPYKRELAEVKTSIKNRLFREKKSAAMEAYVQKLRDSAKIEIDEAILGKAEATRGGPEPGMGPPIFGPGGPTPPGAGGPFGKPGMGPPGMAGPGGGPAEGEEPPQ